jgi:hypothetical protein
MASPFRDADGKVSQMLAETYSGDVSGAVGSFAGAREPRDGTESARAATDDFAGGHHRNAASHPSAATVDRTPSADRQAAVTLCDVGGVVVLDAVTLEPLDSADFTTCRCTCPQCEGRSS